MYHYQLMAQVEAKAHEIKGQIDVLKQSNVSMLWMLKDVESFLRGNGYDTRLVREAIRQNGSAEWGMQMLAEQKRLVTEHHDLLKVCKMLLAYVESDYKYGSGFHGATADVVEFARGAIKNAEESK